MRRWLYDSLKLFRAYKVSVKTIFLCCLAMVWLAFLLSFTLSCLECGMFHFRFIVTGEKKKTQHNNKPNQYNRHYQKRSQKRPNGQIYEYVTKYSAYDFHYLFKIDMKKKHVNNPNVQTCNKKLETFVFDRYYVGWLSSIDALVFAPMEMC